MADVESSMDLGFPETDFWGLSEISLDESGNPAPISEFGFPPSGKLDTNRARQRAV